MGVAGPSEYLEAHVGRMQAEQGGRAPALLYNEYATRRPPRSCAAFPSVRLPAHRGAPSRCRYIVYDVKQVLSKFIVQVEFGFQ